MSHTEHFEGFDHLETHDFDGCLVGIYRGHLEGQLVYAAYLKVPKPANCEATGFYLSPPYVKIGDTPGRDVMLAWATNMLSIANLAVFMPTSQPYFKALVQITSYTNPDKPIKHG